MNIIEGTGLDTFIHSLCTFTGGGGKSSLLYKTAEELFSAGFNVLVSTTTMIYHPDVKKRPYSSLVIADAGRILESLKKSISSPAAFGKGSITIAASEILRTNKELKLKGFSADLMDSIYKLHIFDALLVEGDGAKHFSIKAPGDNEPVIPKETGTVFGVVGLDSLGALINSKTVFRLDQFMQVTHSKENDMIDRKVLLKLVDAENGLFKNSPIHARKILVLNKGDTLESIDTAKETGRYILNKNSVASGVLITCAKDADPVKHVIQKE